MTVVADFKTPLSVIGGTRGWKTHQGEGRDQHSTPRSLHDRDTRVFLAGHKIHPINHNKIDVEIDSKKIFRDPPTT